MRKICIVTGTRADYGLLCWLMKEIQEDADLQLQIVATGMHLSPEFGLTHKTIEEDGFAIDCKVEMLLSSDTPVGITKSIGLGVIGFADVLAQLKPDILVLLGDRYEILAAAQAALVARIPVAHIHGGETTEGAIDESIRHAITKMSHIHFVAAEPYRHRVIQLGERPEHVFNVGAPGLDHVSRLKLLNREQFEQAIGFRLGGTNFLVTYHPATLGDETPQTSMLELLKALDRFPDARIIFTKPNADTGGRIIGKAIDDYVMQNKERVIAFTSLGQVRYLSALRHVDAIIGNSSSGIIEAPAFGIPTVNIGDRQKGRLRSGSVVDCSENADEIARCIDKVLAPEFAGALHGVKSPYGSGETSEQIVHILKTVSLDNIVIKHFNDL